MNSPVISETFTYDNFNRLVSSTKNGTEYRMSYDKYGRILSKEMQGMNFFDARYHSDKPHALKKYTSYTEPPFSNHSVTYTDFDKVETVSMDENTLQFVYGHDHHRRYMTETVDSVTRSKTYIGNCEFVQSATEGTHALTYLYGPSGIYAVAKKVGDDETLYYVHTDHLGSWNVVTDRYRRIVHQYYFDAWGDAKIVDGDGISVNKPLFDRGFTGHEHHYDFGLINMNGRMYDPYTSMFLSPDNYIQAPDNLQSFNRYAYCLNNPLKYTDPSGEFWHIIAGAALGVISNLAFNWNNCDGLLEYVTAFAVGAGSGALTALTGGASAGVQLLAAAGTSAVTSGINNIISQTSDNFSGTVDWNEVGVDSFLGSVNGSISSGVGCLIDKTGLATNVLDDIGVKNMSARNILGSTINGTISGSINSVVGDMIYNGYNFSLLNSALNGTVVGAIGGFVYGSLTEVGYQAQLKYGKGNIINSDFTDATSSALENAINEFKNIGENVETYGTYMLPEITVVAKSITSTYANVYINMGNINSPFTPPPSYKYYSNTLYELLPLLKLY